MKVTIDSSEPLDDALRVIGALYDVTISVAPAATQERPKPVRATRSTSRRNRAGRSATKTAARSARPPRKATAKRGSASTAQLRSWARDNGHEVSDRGPIAASIATAYRAAQQA